MASSTGQSSKQRRKIRPAWTWLPQLRRRTGRPRPERTRAAAPSSSKRGRVICVTSGKGGTGKSVFSANLAYYLARRRHRVLLFDADLGLANAHLLLGIYPKRNLSHVIHGGRAIDEILEPGPAGLTLLSGGAGLSDMAALRQSQIYQIASQLELLQDRFDYVIIDTGAGISPSTMVFTYAAAESIVVTTPDITAMTDAYALLKTLIRQQADAKTWILANRTRTPREAADVYERLRSVSAQYLDHQPAFLGAIPESRRIAASIGQRQPFIALEPRAEVTRRFLRAARKLRKAGPPKSTPLPTDRILPFLKQH